MRFIIRLKWLILIPIIFTSGNLLAQFNVKGKVTDNAGKAIAGASVTASGGQGTQTNNEGSYSLVLPGGTVTITVSSVGYVKQSKTVNVSGNVTVDFVLAESASELGEVILSTGSRSLPRSSVNTPLPIDALSNMDLKSTAQTTFDKQLQYRVPSFNTINTPVNDATTLLDPYEIRNLGPSRTLILINGKRKNLSSLLYV